MTNPQADKRSVERRTRDEQIAAEPALNAPTLSPDAKPTAVETHLGRLHRPVAVAGVVENGLVRPLDPSVKLPEHSHVIIVTNAT